MASYRNKRRKIQQELQALELSNDNNVTCSMTINEVLECDPNIPSQIDQCLKQSNEIIIKNNALSVNLSQNQLQFNLDSSSSTDEESDTDSDKNDDNQQDKFKKKLAEWAVDFNVPQNSINSLLKILRNDGSMQYLPKDCRTLLQLNSSKVVNLREVQPGIYYHFGLGAGISRFSSLIISENTVNIALGIDGLPISKSSSSQFWPILAYIQPYQKHVFPVGIYHGHAKPSDSNLYLQDLVSEIIDLTTNGIIINNSKKTVSINAICCDAPAKAFVMRIKHSGYSSCTRCTIVGEYIKNCVCFPFKNNDHPERSHDDYILMKDDEYHNFSISSLSLIPNINICKLFPLDYMHLTCLGVTKKLIHLWLNKGPVNTRLPSWLCKELTKSLLIVKHSITSDFSRKPRPIEEVSRWKATEFRQFMLYTGIIVLKNILSEDCYLNFLALSISMRILLSHNSYHLINYANKLLKYFVESFQHLYGAEFMSPNIHGLLHLCQDYEKHGALDSCSTFAFENYMKVLKRMLRKHEKPLQQVVRRYAEQSKNEVINKSSDNNNLTYSVKKPDCFILTLNNEIVKIFDIKKSTIAEQTTNDIIIGKTFDNKEDFFTNPLKSSKLDIYIINNLSESFKQWQVSDIKLKMMVFEFDSKLVALPILHHNN